MNKMWFKTGFALFDVAGCFKNKLMLLHNEKAVL